MTLEELYYADFEIMEPELVLQSWNDSHSYTGYQCSGRPYDGLMLITGDIRMEFSMIDGVTVTAAKNDLVYLPMGLRYTVRIEWEAAALPRIHAPKRSMVCVKAEAYRLLRHVLSFCVGESEKRYPIRAGVEYLKLHWNENTPVSELATLCGMSECYFRRLFGKFAGMNPVRYRTLIRISAAKSMLSAGGMSVVEVAEAVGFEDCFYFSRVFKSIVGVSPSVYARNPQK